MNDYLFPRAIAIQVPKPDDTCFVVIPFSDEFDLLYRLIADAATRVGLRPIRTDYVVQDQDIMRQIHTDIRSAKLVVAVCSPVANGQPNVNVMYEIGYARALGKSTLLVTTPATLPFDLGHRRLVEYTAGQLSDNKECARLVKEIRDAMYTLTDAMDKVDNPLTDPKCSDVSVIPSAYAIPDLWINVQTIILFAKTIHHEMQNLQHICLDALQAKATQVRENAPKTHIPFRDALTAFRLYWLSSPISQHLTTVVSDERTVEFAILFLKQHLRQHGEKYICLCHSHDSHAGMKPLLKEYPTLRDQLETRDAPVAYLVQTVIELSTKTKFLLTHADNLLKDMAIVMAER